MEMAGYAGIACKIMDRGGICADFKKCPGIGALFKIVEIIYQL